MMEPNGLRRNIAPGDNFMKTTKSSKKVTKLPGSIIVQTMRTIKVTKPKAEIASPTIRVDYPAFQAKLSPKPSTVEVDNIIAATYDVLNKACISFETVEEDNLFHDSLSNFLRQSFDCETSTLDSNV